MKKPEVFLFLSAYVLLILSNFRQNFITLSHVQKKKVVSFLGMLVEKLSEIIFCSIRKNTQFAFGYLRDRSGSKREFCLFLIYEQNKFRVAFFRKSALGAAPKKVNDLSCSILTDIGIYFAFYTCIALSI